MMYSRADKDEKMKSRRKLKAVEESDLNCSSLNLLCFLRGRDSKASFHDTPNSTNSKKMKKSANGSRGANSVPHVGVGHKVLPITDAGNTNTRSQRRYNDEKIKGSRMNAISRMKELITTTKGERSITRKGLNSNFKAGSKAIPGNGEDSCSIYSANEMDFYHRDQLVGRGGNWITTDSEYVVLEL